MNGSEFQEFMVAQMVATREDIGGIKADTSTLKVQNARQFEMIERNAQGIASNNADINALKEHRTGKGPLARLLIWAFFGKVT